MTNYITMSDVVKWTGLDTNSVDSFNDYIEDAQIEFETRTNRTFDGTEDDYAIAQRALAFLVAYYIRIKREEIEFAKTELAEYDRLIKMLMRDSNPETQKFWNPQIQTITQEDMGDTSR